MNNTAQKGNIVTALLIGVVFIGLTSISIWYFYSLPNNPTSPPNIQSSDIPITSVNPQPTESTNTSEESQRYTSKNLKISFQIPQGYSIEEKFNDIFLKKENNEITISSHGSLYDNSKEHVAGMEDKNKFKFNSKMEYTGNNKYTFTKTIQTDPNDKTKTQLSYYGVSNYNVAIIYTSNNGIEHILESIVNSFEFI